MSHSIAPIISAATWAESLLARLAEQGVDPDDLIVLRTQVAELARAGAPATTPDPTVPRIVRDAQTLKAMAEALAEAPAVAIDLETSSLDHRTGEIVGIGLAIEGLVVYVPTGHRFLDTGQLLPDQLPVGEVVGVLDLEKVPLIAHNAKFELNWLRCHAAIEPSFIWDTMLAASLLHSDLSVDLKGVAIRELDVPDWGLPSADMNRIQFLPLERVARYCAKDVVYTLHLMRKQQACLV